MRHLRRALRPVAGAALLTATLTAPAVAAPGDFDPAFNHGTPVFTNNAGAAYDNLERVAIGPDGKIVGAGCGCAWGQAIAAVNGGPALSLQRWNTDGSHDDGFGDAGGVQDHAIPGLPFGQAAYPTALAVGADSSVYAAVSTPLTAVLTVSGSHSLAQQLEGADYTVARYDGAGGNEYRQQVDVPGLTDVTPTGLLPLAGGGALGVGWGWDDEDGLDSFVVRQNADGSLDSTFFGDGILQPHFTEEPNEVLVGIGHQPGAPEGTFVVAGLAFGDGEATNIVGFVARFTADGQLDPTFGTGGVATQPFDSDRNSIYENSSSKRAAFAIGPDGKLYLGEPEFYGLHRFGADGTPDTAFGDAGLVKLVADEDQSSLTGIGVQPNGKIVTVGNRYNFDPYGTKVVVARFKTDGTLDTGYADGGTRVLTFTAATEDQVINDLAMQTDGKPVIGGTSSIIRQPEVRQSAATARAAAATGNPSGTRWVTARLDGDPLPTPPVETPTTPTPTTPTPTTPTATTPAITPAPVAAAGGKRVCVSRRAFRIRLRIPRGQKALTAVVRVNGKKVKTLRGKRITAPVNLTGLPKGRFTVKISVKLATGKVLTGQRKYRTCTRKLPPSNDIKL